MSLISRHWCHCSSSDQREQLRSPQSSLRHQNRTSCLPAPWPHLPSSHGTFTPLFLNTKLLLGQQQEGISDTWSWWGMQVASAYHPQVGWWQSQLYLGIKISTILHGYSKYWHMGSLHCARERETISHGEHVPGQLETQSHWKTESEI